MTTDTPPIVPKKHIPFYTILALSFISFGLAVFLGIRIFTRVDHQPRPIPRQTNVTLIQTWMTLPYISKVYGVPMPEFEKELGVAKADQNKSIEALAKKMNTSPQALLGEIQKIIANFQIEHSKPPSS